MSSFETALNRIAACSRGVAEEARQLLREMIAEACQSLSAAEGSILVPTSDSAHLKFLISINPELDNSDLEFAINESVSGFVFNSGQAIAKINPESVVRDRVDKVTKVTTEYLMAVPITDANKIWGVATFVNRTGEFEDQPFSASELQEAQAFGEVYATAMKFYRHVELSANMTLAEVCENAKDLGVSVESGASASVNSKDTEELRFASQLVETSQALNCGERRLLNQMADLLLEHFRNDRDDF